MACPNPNGFLLLRRSYAVATENATMQPILASMRKQKEVKVAEVKAAEDLGGDQHKEKNFWMRDPKTGNWIPENHFDEVDVAELREKHLSRK